MNILPQSGKSLLPSLVKVRPMLLLTGFLGAGKTTFLRDVLAHLATREYRADIILNDRENAFIDKETLKGHAADISALTASCVCCDGYEDLVTMILKASESQHDILVIELNGTADPIPLQESFTLLESKFFLRPRWQICVIDARYFRKRRRFNDLESLQLETASHYFISHSSNLTEKERAELEGAIKTINSGASRTTASLLVDALSQAIASNSSHVLANSDSGRGQPCSTKFEVIPQSTENLREHKKLAHQFTGCNIILPEAIDSPRIFNWLESLPPSVMRAKALLSLAKDDEHRYLFERVGQVVSPHPISVRAIENVPCSGIFIGADLDPEEILRSTKKNLHPDCHFSEL